MPVQLVMDERGPADSPTIVRLEGGIQIELGSDLTIVEAVIRQLTATAMDRAPQAQHNQVQSNMEGGASC